MTSCISIVDFLRIWHDVIVSLRGLFCGPLLSLSAMSTWWVSGYDNDIMLSSESKCFCKWNSSGLKELTNWNKHLTLTSTNKIWNFFYSKIKKCFIRLFLIMNVLSQKRRWSKTSGVVYVFLCYPKGVVTSAQLTGLVQKELFIFINPVFQRYFLRRADLIRWDLWNRWRMSPTLSMVFS